MAVVEGEAGPTFAGEEVDLLRALVDDVAQLERAAALHGGRAVRLFERMGSEWAAQIEGMSEGEFLARLDSTIGKALTRVEVVMRSGAPPDSVERPPGPRPVRDSTRPDSTPPR